MIIADAVRYKIESFYSVIFSSASGITMTPLVSLMTMPSYDHRTFQSVLSGTIFIVFMLCLI